MSGDSGSWKSSHAVENASSRGWLVVVPGSNELLIDLDDDASVDEFHKRLTKFCDIHDELVDAVRS